MATLMDVLAAKGTQPQAQQTSPVEAQGQPQPQPQAAPANPLAALAGRMGAQQQQAPAPTHAQTVAVMHRLGQIKTALRPVMDDPHLGSKNIRPKLLDAASKLLAAKVVSLTDIMSEIKGLPEDPIEQKKFVEGLYNNATQGQTAILEQHRHADLPEGSGPDEWTPETHDDHIASLMQQYGGGNA